MKTTIEDAMNRGYCFCTLCSAERPLNAKCLNGCDPYLAVLDTPPEGPTPEPDKSGFLAMERAYIESELVEETLRLAGYPVAARRQRELRATLEPLLASCREYFELVEQNNAFS